MYVKPGYAPCRAAVAMMERVRETVPFDLQQIDVTEDESLSKKYGSDVPVVTINGTEAFRTTVPEAAFKRRLKRAKKGGPAALAPPQEAAAGKGSPGVRVPLPVRVAIVLAVLVGAGYFIQDGIAAARTGRGRLARSLLKVEARNEAPPSFTLERMRGGQAASEDQFRGRVVFINFWATWCPPCVEEMPSMLRLKEKMRDEPRFDMLAISTDEAWAPVRKFFERAPPFEVLLDKEGDLARRYGTEKFPETYVVVDGRLVGYIIGPRDWDTWYAEAYLRALVNDSL